MTDEQETGAVLERINTLHRHFDRSFGQVGEKIDRLEGGQAALIESDREHYRRLGLIEVAQAKTEGHLATHIATTGIVLAGMGTSIDGVRSILQSHTTQEDADRKKLMYLLVATLLAATGGLVGMLFTLAVRLFGGS